MAMLLSVFETVPKETCPIFATRQRQESSRRIPNIKNFKNHLPPIPQYQYSKEELLELKVHPTANVSPSYLNSDCFSGSGRWNPALYFDNKRNTLPKRKNRFKYRKNQRKKRMNSDTVISTGNVKSKEDDKVSIIEMLQKAKVASKKQEYDQDYIKQLEDYLKMLILGKPRSEESAYNKLLHFLSDACLILPRSSISIGPWDKSKALMESDIIGSTSARINTPRRNISTYIPVGRHSNRYQEGSETYRKRPEIKAALTENPLGNFRNNIQQGIPCELSQLTQMDRIPRSYQSSNSRGYSSKQFDSFTPTSVIRKVLLEKQTSSRTNHVSERNEKRNQHLDSPSTSNQAMSRTNGRDSPHLNERKVGRNQRVAANPYWRQPYNMHPLQTQGYLPQVEVAALNYVLRNPQYLQNTPQQYLLTPWSSFLHPAVQIYYNQLQQILRWADSSRINR